MSWAGFWIKLANAPARVALCVTTYLSIKTLGQEKSHSLYRHSIKYTCESIESILSVIYQKFPT